MSTFTMVLNGVIALWVLVDSRRRKEDRWLLWTIFAAIGWPVMFPFYFAYRNLKDGEVRSGGKAWNVLKNFALVWTLGCVVMGVRSCFDFLDINEADPGASVGDAMLVSMIWFFSMVGFLVFGLFLRNSGIVERGPTGPLEEKKTIAPTV